MIVPWKLKFKKLTQTAKLPTRGSEYSAGLDLYVDECEWSSDFGVMLVKYGIAVEIPEGYCGLIIERSSLHKKGLAMANSIGVIDADYRGELMTPFKIGDHYNSHTTPEKGERVAQLVIVPFQPTEPEFVDELSDTDRGEGGFGSTGVT